MPRITIDNRTIDVEANTSIIKAAERVGIYIPRYCYHPSLSIVATCRMCIVEVEKAPKLMPACSTQVMDGMVVHTDTEKVKSARKEILEFLLINHPLDCPICDQAGECFLQDYYMDYGLYHSRFRQEDKIRRRKRRIIGNNLVLDNERCILCSRCVRFLQEVTKTEELTVAERGDNSEIDLREGKTVDNPYSLNLADICPVGAITSRDFRFQSRVWFLQRTNSICTGCATGCNVEAHHRNGKVYRLLPRHNGNVNGHWMCDFGRLSYKVLMSESRVTKADIRVNEGTKPGNIKDVLKETIKIIEKIIKDNGADSIGVMGSANQSLENNLALAEFARKSIGTKNICMDFPFEQGIKDGILINKDPMPNSSGARLIHTANNGISIDQFFSLLKAGRIKLVIVSGNDLYFFREKLSEVLSDAPKPKIIGFMSDMSNFPWQVDCILPVPTCFEERGMFINYAGLLQKTEPAVSAKDGIKPLWELLNEASLLMGKSIELKDRSAILGKLSQTIKEINGITYEKIGEKGVKVL